MKTTKEIARNAYVDGAISVMNSKMTPGDREHINGQFELWWSKIYNGTEDRCKVLIPEHSVWIDGKRYIQAE